MTTTTIPISLNTEKDKDILKWWNDLSAYRRSATGREAIRYFIRNNGKTSDERLIDIYQLLLEMKQNGIVTIASREEIEQKRTKEGLGDLPPDIAATLDKLGL